MPHIVTVTAKKHFLKWFLRRYEPQKKEAVWLLNYLLANDKLLEKVHFIDNFKNLPKTILISTKCVDMTPFKFYKNKKVTPDVEKAFHDIRSNPDEDIYIGLFFKDKDRSPEYAAVLEGNPMERQDVVHDVVLELMAEIVLDRALRSFKREKLYQEIDRALAEGNKEAFLALTEELRALSADDWL
ncbi:ReoY family proteolytic degradation factor [Bacillaceae bacterium]